jgi:hypothetical protein
MVIMEILLSPGSLPIKLGYWLSLLLCVRPRWPKIIEEAGQPGKLVPEISKIDDYPPEIAAKLKMKKKPKSNARSRRMKERKQQETARLPQRTSRPGKDGDPSRGSNPFAPLWIIA